AHEPERQRAWEVLAEAYWKPVYKHLRLRWRRAPEDAEDLTQSFFAEALRRGLFADHDPEKARFRTYVRVCLDGFASNDKRSRERLKRGGAVEIRSLDAGVAEEELARAAGDERSPEARFDREFQRSVLTLSIEALRAHCEAKDKREHFEVFERYDLAEDGERPTYEAIGAELGMTATTVTNRLAYARQQLRRLVIERLEALTATREELRDEARALLGVELP
ncbi:MAG: sigma-70 family RNA polymerase sigma factor, partial [Polyangiaceae bacterium]